MESVIREEVKRVFTPEFLNRIDDQIVFYSLNKESLISIVDILLSFLQKNLSERGILLEVSQAAKTLIVDKNYDATLGARPLRRGIQQMVEDEIAEGLLMGRYKDFSTIIVDVEEGKLTFKSESLSSEVPKK
jgi:ATP-dependent Clp protease ATP-binding subunit ClpC